MLDDDPAEVYGPGVRAAICYLSAYQHLPAKRLAEATDSPVRPADLDRHRAAVLGRGPGLAGFEEQVKEHLAAAPVAHADETGGAGRGLTALAARDVHPPGDLLRYPRLRGRDSDGRPRVLPAFTGTLVTDALASYTVYGDDQALCGAHVLRELHRRHRGHPPDPPGRARSAPSPRRGRQQAVAGRALAPATSPPAETATAGRVVRHAPANPYSGRDRSKARALAERLRDRIEEYQRYMVGFAVPFDNNQRRARPADGQGAAEGLRILAHPDRRQALCPDSLLHLHRAQTRRQPPHRPTRPLRRTAMDAAHHR